MPLPNFLIIGAAKAGTTSLYDWFRPHPQIFMPQKKEPCFFSYEGQTGRYFQVRTLEDYRALFEDVTDEIAIGEASTTYLHTPAAAARIRNTLPGVRLIASLRDPVDRARSFYEMKLRARNKNAGQSFLQALEADPELRDGYYPFLKSYLERFDPAALRIILFEDIVDAPAATVRSLFEFLGVRPDFQPDVSRVSNPGGLPRSLMLHRFLKDPRVRRFGRVLPRRVVEGAHRLQKANLRKQTLRPEDRAQALEHFRDDIRRTQDLIGRDLSHWLRA
jgi:hypothetical protein